ncbi:MAG: bifunctional metallophosphatase/5'-nucleotidase [Pseudomonadota bacterium]|nr:bifunctional metallophosphatase/5'-nucleotidase [Pseudomonadota bacterium]
MARWLLPILLFLPLAGCVSRHSPGQGAAAAPAGQCTFLSVNDTYRIEPQADGTGGLARLRTLRKRLEAEYGAVTVLHAGDFLGPSLLSRTYKGAQMIEVLSALDGDPAAMDPRMYVTFGNHEFDAGKMADGAALDAMIGQSQFRWLGTNITFAPGESGAPAVADPNLLASDRFDCGGISIGLFGITTSRKSADFVESFADPIATAKALTAALRADGAEVVVALTHQAMEEDKAIFFALGDDGPDVIFGGHEHDHQVGDVLPRRASDTLPRRVYKADADARSAWRFTIRRVDGALQGEEELVVLDAAVPEDPAVKGIVDARLAAHDARFCAKADAPAGCLAAPTGRTSVPLVGAELDFRRFETNLGNWLADRARAAYPDAQIAFLNSGGVRLNRDIAPGPITRQDIEEIFAYPTPLVRVELDGATLEKVVARAVEDWTGNGHWLQISGFSWSHDPVAGTATRLTWLGSGEPIGRDERIIAVVPTFLADPKTGQDGYTMIPAAAGPPGPDLKELVLAALAAAPAGIAPTVEGRICNTQRPGPCLAR